MDLRGRLAEFYRRLEAAPPAANAEDAFALICRLINEVEDELCPLPRENPPPMKFTGRMYPPQADHCQRLPNGTLQAFTRHHRINCQPTGRISIDHLPSRKLEFYKQGRTP